MAEAQESTSPETNGPQTNGRTEIARLPRPIVRKTAWPSLLFWLVPVAVAVGAAFYFHKIFEEHGPVITIAFRDGSGLKVGETPLTVRGVRVGTVNEVDMSPDFTHAIVHVRFQRGTSIIAKKDTIFYMVRPDMAGGNFAGLSTLITGPYIEAIPGHGEDATDFVGVESPPSMLGQGIHVTVHFSAIDRLQVNSPVYYRGVQVGLVQDLKLAEDSTQVNATLFIWHRYAKLLYTNSKFWPVVPAKLSGGLVDGVNVQVNSLRSFLGGGLNFATPEIDRGTPATEGVVFGLYREPETEWLWWEPKIYLDPEPKDGDDNGQEMQRDQGGLRSTIRIR